MSSDEVHLEASRGKWLEQGERNIRPVVFGVNAKCLQAGLGKVEVSDISRLL